MKNLTFGVGIRNLKSLFVSLTKFPKARALLTLHSKSTLKGNVLSTRQLKPNGQCTLCVVGARASQKNKKATGLSELRSCSRSSSLHIVPTLALSEWRLGAAFICHKNGALSSLAKLDVLLEI